MSIEQLKKQAVITSRIAEEAKERVERALAQLEEAELQKKLEKQKTDDALAARYAVDNTTLPKWAVEFIQAEAYSSGHSSGQSEVDMITVSMIHHAEEYHRKYVKPRRSRRAGWYASQGGCTI